MKNLSAIKDFFRSYPRGLYVLLYTEMWELFGRFGIGSLLVLYLTKTFHFSDDKSFMLYAAFLALLYVTPIAGGIVCDKILGNRHSIILGATVMLMGNLLLVVPELNLIYLGLALIALGSGFFLPSVAPLVGRLYDGSYRSRDSGFTLYYLGKNVGALLAPGLCGLVGVYFGWNYAFILSALGMLSGLIVFIMGHHHLKEYDIAQTHVTRASKKKILSVYLGGILLLPLIIFALSANIEGYVLVATGCIVLLVLFQMVKNRTLEERRNVVAILVMMLFVVIFESFLNQGGSTLNLFIDRLINRKIFGTVLPTTFFYSLDPAFMMILGPALTVLWMKLAKVGREPGIVSKFALALCSLSVGFLIFTLAARYAESSGQASLLYVVIAYVVFPFAELCIVPIGLSMVTKLAPRGMDALMVGIWMLSSALSSYLSGQIARLGEIKFSLLYVSGLQKAAAVYMHAFSIMMVALLAAGCALIILRRKMNKLFVLE